MARKTLKETLDQPLPVWIEDIKNEVYQEIANSRFAKRCRGGDKKIMQCLIKRFWPFVDVFPKLVESGVHTFVGEDVAERLGVSSMIELYRQGSKILSEIKQDEEGHRELWLKSAETLGVLYSLDTNPTKSIDKLIWAFKTAKDSFQILMGVIAVEMVAESVSKNFLTSQQFKAALGSKGILWFKEHIAHSDLTHEKLAWQLAIASSSSDLSKDKCRGVIKSFCSLFIEGGESCSCER